MISPLPSFLYSRTFWYIYQELSSLASSSNLERQWNPENLFFLRYNAINELARHRALLSAIYTLLKPFLLYLSFPLLSLLDLKRTFSTKFFAYNLEEIVLLRYARCSLSRFCWDKGGSSPTRFFALKNFF